MANAPRTHRVLRLRHGSAIATVTAISVIAAACGGGSGDASSSSTDAVRTEVASSAPEVEVESVEVEAVDVGAETTTTSPPPPTAEPTSSAPATDIADNGSQAGDGDGDEPPVRGDTPFNGPSFTDLANARMQELGATFTLPVTPDALASIFELPGDFPYPAGAVIGVFHDVELDQRSDDEIRIDEERIVGIDGPGDPASLDAIQLAVEGATASRWQRASSQRNSFNTDLYTALPLDGSEVKDRLVVRGVEIPDPGEPSLQITFEQRAAEMAVPIWKAGLPTLEGGLLSSVREGRGVVDAFGRNPRDGFVEMREYYEIDRFEELEAFFASGIIESAGFTYEDTPFNNFSIRVDVSNGEWAGTVGVGEITIDGELFGYQLIWTLTRSA